MKGKTRNSAMYTKAKIITESTRIFFLFFSIMCDLYNCINLDDWMIGMNAMTRMTTITTMTRMITKSRMAK